jgi:hypothetical protein
MVVRAQRILSRKNVIRISTEMYVRVVDNMMRFSSSEQFYVVKILYSYGGGDANFIVAARTDDIDTYSAIINH